MSVAVYVICWLLFAAIFIVSEIITLGLTTIWFAGGAIVAAIAAFAGAGLVVQILLFGIVSVILLVSTRPIARKYFDSKTQKTNVEALIEKTANVIEEVNNQQGTGKATINGMEWTARSEDDTIVIPAGTLAIVKRIEGVKLILSPEQKNKKDIEQKNLDDIQVV